MNKSEDIDKNTLSGVIPIKYLKKLKCPRCNGLGDDPCSEHIYREFKCNLCRGVGDIIMVDPEFYLQ